MLAGVAVTNLLRPHHCADLLFVRTVSLIPRDFAINIGLTIASSGSSLGDVIYPVVLNRVEPLGG